MSRSADKILLGEERLVGVIRKNMDKSAAGIVDDIFQAVWEFAGMGSHIYDLTVVIVKCQEKSG